MKEIVKRWTPPGLLDLVRLARTPRKVVYANYVDAKTACQSGAYENENLVRAVVAKNKKFRKQLEAFPSLNLQAMRTVIALTAVATAGRSLKVIDFGGGGGAHYAIAKTVLGPDCEIFWNVVETVAMVKEAQSLSDGNLKFFDSLEDAMRDLGDIDLIFTSSALQYCPAPLAALDQLIALSASYIFITRTPLSSSNRTLITVQHTWLSENGPGPLPQGFRDQKILYPITYVSRKTVEDKLKIAYDVRFSTDEGSGVFDVDGDEVRMDGYFCCKKAKCV